MTREEARLLLASYRPGAGADSDPRMAEALDLARRDPELGQWLEQELALDALIAEKLRSVAAPAGLKDRIVAGTRTFPDSVPVPLARLPRRRRPLAVVALAILTAALALVAWNVGGTARKTPAFAAYEGNLVGQIVSGEVGRLNFTASDAATLKGWLAAHGAPSDIDVPPGAQRLPGIGCRTFTWNGKPVSQICFALEDGKIVHLFVIGQGAWKAAPPEGHPQFSSHGDWTLASWREGGATYIMARIGGEADLAKLFSNQT